NLPLLERETGACIPSGFAPHASIQVVYVIVTRLEHRTVNQTAPREHEEFFARWMVVIGVVGTRLKAEQEIRRATGSQIHPEDFHGDASRVDSALDERLPFNLCGLHMPVKDVCIH